MLCSNDHAILVQTRSRHPNQRPRDHRRGAPHLSSAAASDVDRRGGAPARRGHAPDLQDHRAPHRRELRHDFALGREIRLDAPRRRRAAEPATGAALGEADARPHPRFAPAHSGRTPPALPRVRSAGRPESPRGRPAPPRASPRGAEDPHPSPPTPAAPDRGPRATRATDEEAPRPRRRGAEGVGHALHPAGGAAPMLEE